jgi:protein TonB
MSKAWTVVGIVGALVVHAAILLFGGVLFFRIEEDHASKRDVELVAEDVKKDKTDEQQPEDRPKEEIKQDKETPPDPNQAIKSVDSAVTGDDAPALDAASLSAIEAALNGGGASGGAGDFGGAASLQGGGRIGGTGKVGAADEQVDAAFSMSEIDQRPRAVHQVAGAYPSEMRSRNVEGVVTLIFIVDETGRVANPRVEKASHPEFEKPALDAVRQWKFEPAVKAGKRVGCRMRVSVRFQPR